MVCELACRDQYKSEAVLTIQNAIAVLVEDAKAMQEDQHWLEQQDHVAVVEALPHHSSRLLKEQMAVASEALTGPLVQRQE